MAITYTPNLNLPMMGSEDPANIETINEAFRAVDAAFPALEAGKAARNHLDDSYFLEPVNQRGATTYSAAGYGIDRWRHGNSNLTVAVASTGIRLTNASTTSGLAWQQLIDRNLSGKAVTVACCQSNGAIAVGTGIIPAEAVSSDTVVITARFADESASVLLYKQANGLISYRIFVAAGKTVTLRWAALYEGAYTAKTLPAYIPRGYAAELAECRRYYCRWDIGELVPWLVSTAARRYSISYPQQMRGGSPTVDTSELRERSVWTDLGASFEPSTSSSDGIIIIATATASDSGSCHLGGVIAVSKDL